MMNRTFLAGALLAAGFGWVTPASAAPQASPFTVVVLPDTQAYSALHPDIFEAQTQWIVDNAQARNIRFVTHVGDVVDSADKAVEWERADAAMSKLDDAGIPYGVIPGNHDWEVTGDRTSNLDNYLEYFGPERFQGKPWFGGAMPGRPANTYQVIEAGGRRWLNLALEWRHDFNTNPDLGILEWADGVLAAHPDLPTMVTTHEDLRDDNLSGTGGGITAPGNLLFDELVRKHDQVFAIISGHNHFGPNQVNADGEWREVSINDFGNPVHRMMTTFQDWPPTGGEGFLRLLTFQEDFSGDLDRILVETYSPTLDQFLLDALGPTASRFQISFDFDQRFGVIPEPGSAALLAGAALLGLRRRRRLP